MDVCASKERANVVLSRGRAESLSMTSNRASQRPSCTRCAPTGSRPYFSLL